MNSTDDAKPDLPVLQSVDLPDGTGRLVLYDWMANKSNLNQNLACFDATGNLMWRAELPKGQMPECYVNVDVDGEVIGANTWSCHRVTLDRRTGKILTSVFTK